MLLLLGVGGNLAAVQASRLFTTLHQQGKAEEFKDITQYHASKLFPNPYKIFCSTTVLIQVAISLYIAPWMVIFIWRHERDSDNVYIPYLTIIEDLLDDTLLICVFLLLF
ncbi:unnamed protein product [Adineta steineri]|uniref:SLC41A/MgtE integral membrane domain-containing protein n=1 Tax=Adineta steineri TaxID=433720 RepID=A0A819UNJ3_9BILA|nr:unnamed protein product [Adineta steineri]